MSAEQRLTIRCDGTERGCHGALSTSTPRTTLNKYRNVAKQVYGWFYRDGLDLCPVCAKAAKSVGEIPATERQAELDTDSRVTR